MVEYISIYYQHGWSKLSCTLNMHIYGMDCRIASYAEWKILYMLCKDKNGVLQKDTVRAVYDGRLFEQMVKEKAAASSSKEKWVKIIWTT